MTDLDRMLTAARQIGEVVGENLLARLIVDREPAPTDGREDDVFVGLECVLPAPEGGYYTATRILHDADALDLLTARVWRAVQGWANSRGLGCLQQADRGYTVWSTDTVNGQVPNAMVPYTFDLPSAVAAIHKHWKESQ